ncbi:MAG: SDR family NAD(P)-dependent oxidoreductase [Bacteroidia bacterium]
MLTQLLIPVLAQNEQAVIINTSRGWALSKADGLVYKASKAAMRNFTTGLRFVLKEKGIRWSLSCP